MNTSQAQPGPEVPQDRPWPYNMPQEFTRDPQPKRTPMTATEVRDLSEKLNRSRKKYESNRELVDIINEAPDQPPKGLLRPIHVSPKDRGFVVTIGCADFCIESRTSLVSWLSDYINDPDAMEAAFQKGEIFPR